MALKGIEVRSGARGGVIMKETIENMIKMAQEHHIEPPYKLVCNPCVKDMVEEHLKQLVDHIEIVCEAVMRKDEMTLIGREPEVFVPFSYMDTPIYKAYSNLPKEDADEKD